MMIKTASGEEQVVGEKGFLFTTQDSQLYHLFLIPVKRKQL